MLVKKLNVEEHGKYTVIVFMHLKIFYHSRIYKERVSLTEIPLGH